MDLFRSGIKTVLGAPQTGEQISGAETVERLVDRLETSTLLEDRRDACRALKAMSRRYRVEVGAHGMNCLLRALHTDSNDTELSGYALDTLCNITSPEPLDEEPPEAAAARCGEQFTEMFIKQPDRVSLVLSLLEEFDFKVRWPAVKLLYCLLINKPREVQDLVLVSPMGVSKLMDLLSDSREVIRNDTLLLLIQLTKGNANIQKIVAFENAFDRIFDVIKHEGLADGGIIVQDCLLLMLNLLRNNTSNMNFFKEGSYIQRLAPMFKMPSDEENREMDRWTPQRVANIHCMLQVIRALVSPGNPGQVTSPCQKVMHSSGLLAALCDILMASGVPTDVLTETINTVAEVIRGDFTNQEYFANVMAPSTPPRSAIVVLVMSMVNEKQPFMLRCSVLYCFQCFVYKNEFGQAQLIGTLLPASTQVPTLTLGQLLCGGLFSPDQLSNWFSAVALSHAIYDNTVEKERLLKVLLATSPGAPPVSLLHQCSVLLQQSNKLQSQVGLLILLVVWLANSPIAVATFLAIPSNIPFLTAKASSTEHDETEELVQGLCAFLIGICIHYNNNSVTSFTKESLSQIIAKRIGLDEFLDKLSTVSRHETYSHAAKHPQVRPRQPPDLLLDHEFCRLLKGLEGVLSKSVSPSDVPDSMLVLQYKDVIRDQDTRLQELATDLSRLRVDESALRQQVEALQGKLAQLQDENVLLRACAGQQSAADSTRTLVDALQAEMAHLKAENAALRLSSIELSNSASNDPTNSLQEVASLREEVARERASGSRMAAELAHLRGELSRVGAELIAEKDRVTRAEADTSDVDKLRADQDNLLELLAEQDEKLALMKDKLRMLGQKVDEEESDDDHSTSLSGT